MNAQQQVAILYKGKSLDYVVYHEQAKQSQVVSAKDVDAALNERVYTKPAHNQITLGAIMALPSVAPVTAIRPMGTF